MVLQLPPVDEELEDALEDALDDPLVVVVVVVVDAPPFPPVPAEPPPEPCAPPGPIVPVVTCSPLDPPAPEPQLEPAEAAAAPRSTQRIHDRMTPGCHKRVGAGRAPLLAAARFGFRYERGRPGALTGRTLRRGSPLSI
jgi:hypothetical protein